MSDDIVVNTDELTANDTVVVDMPQIGGTVEILFGVGPQGLEGDRGPRGYFFTPTVSEEGVISWTNDGNLPNPEPISIKGPKGDKGDPISIHICSSGEYDSTTRVPTVQNPETNVFYLVPAEDPQSTDLFSEWVYVNGAWELFGSAKVDLSNYVQKTDYATNLNAGVVKVLPAMGLGMSSIGILTTVRPTADMIRTGGSPYRPITPTDQHTSTFYGLAKAAGDATQSQSSNPVGTYTDEAKAAIQQMLDVPSNDDIPDIQVATTEEVEEIITAYEEDEDMVFEMTFENLGHGEGRYTSVATTETIMNAYYAGKHVVLHFPEVSDFGVIGECWTSIIGANKDDNRLYCSTMLNSEQLTEMIISGDHVLVEIFS